LYLRRLLLVMVAATAITAVLGGLGRVGLFVSITASLAPRHGPAFVLGVFVTVIALERAVALGKALAYVAPILAAAGALGTLAGTPHAAYASLLASVALVGTNVAIVRRQSVSFTWLMLLGSLVLALGNAAWLAGRPIFEIVPTWMGFFVTTIVAERIELSRLAPTPRWASRLVVVLGALFALSTFGWLVPFPENARLLGASLGALGLWQLRFDLARRTLRRPGLPRFAALGVLLGAGWLIVAAAILLEGGTLPPAGLRYDAILHAVFVGYVLSMVFAHAPIILPAVARIAIPFHPVLFVPLAVLHLSLAARVVGDLALLPAARSHGSLGNALALALYAASLLAARRSQRTRAR
ncbi:MAG: hypothetical protein KC586_25040, partial [Myxococcales bacterium]|nr:hypothetical protein [Myxococcales bacterium]